MKHRLPTAELRSDQLARLLLSALSPAELVALGQRAGLPPPAAASTRRERHAFAALLVGLLERGGPAADALRDALRAAVREAADLAAHGLEDGSVDLLDLLDGRLLARAILACALDERDTVRRMGRDLLRQYESLAEEETAPPASPEAESAESVLAQALAALFGEAVDVLAAPQLAEQGRLLVVGPRVGVRVVRLEAEAEAVVVAPVAEAAPPDAGREPVAPAVLAGDEAEAALDLDAIERLADGLADIEETIPDEAAHDEPEDHPAVVADVEPLPFMEPGTDDAAGGSPSPSGAASAPRPLDALLSAVDALDAMVRPAAPREALSEELSFTLPLDDLSAPATYPKVFHGDRVVLFGGYDKLDAEYREIVEAFGGTYERHNGAANYPDERIEELVARSDVLIVLHNAIRDIGAIKAVSRARESGRRYFLHHSVSPRSVGGFLHQLIREQRI